MCRNIRPLNNLEPPATSQEIHDAALQYVRKISGSARPSQANAEAVAKAAEEIARISTDLIESLVTAAPPRNREVEAAKARARFQARLERQRVG